MLIISADSLCAVETIQSTMRSSYVCRTQPWKSFPALLLCSQNDGFGERGLQADLHRKALFKSRQN